MNRCHLVRVSCLDIPFRDEQVFCPEDVDAVPWQHTELTPQLFAAHSDVAGGDFSVRIFPACFADISSVYGEGLQYAEYLSL